MHESTPSAKSRGRIWQTASNLILHLHPARVPAEAIRFNRTLGLGGISALLVMLQILTGFLLKFQYIPSVDKAYLSINFLQENLVFGRLIRNFHHWSGQFLLVITAFHLARIIFTSAYFPPRKANWYIGLFLFITVLLMCFTGYLLPWDQLSYWAVTVSGSMLDYIPLAGKFIKLQFFGGNQVSQATLMNFYNFHTGVLPVVLVILMAYHFWKVRKANGIALPAPQGPGMKRETVPVIPPLVVKELVTGLVVIAFLLVFSLLVNAPLLEKANPSISPNPAKAPWYFMGIQELIVHFHPFFSVFLVPAVLITGFFLIPLHGQSPVIQGTWFGSPKTSFIMVRTLIFTCVFVTVWIVADEYLIQFNQWLPGIPYWVSEGLLPFLVISTLLSFGGKIILNRYRMAYHELIMNGFVFILTAYFILMMTGIFFRGPGMELIFPI